MEDKIIIAEIPIPQEDWEKTPASIQELIKHLEEKIQKQAGQTALAASEGKLRSLLENAPGYIVQVDRQGTMLFLNRVAPGFSLEEVIGHNLAEFTAPESQQIQQAAIERVFQTGEPTIIETVGMGANRSVAHYEVRISPLGNGKQVESVMLITMDITERKQAETDLRESEKKFQQLAQSINQVFFIHEAKTLDILYVSPAFENVWGIECDRLYQDAFIWAKSLHPEDYERVMAAAPQVSQGAYFTNEYRIIRPDGEIRWIYARTFPVVDDFGRLYRIAGIAEDITERKQLELALQQFNQELEQRVAQRTEELSQQTQLLQTILRSMGDGVIVANTAGEIILLNPAAKQITGLGIPNSDTEQWQNFWGIYLADDSLCPTEQLPLVRAMRGESIDKSEIILRNGSYPEGIYVEATGRPLLDSGGNLMGGVAVFRDVSDRKKVEMALREAQEFTQRITENTPNIIYVYDLIKKCNIYSNRQIFNSLGYTEEEIRAMGSRVLPNLLHPDDWQKAMQYQQAIALMQDGEIGESEYRMRHADGSWRYLSDRAIIFKRDAEGRVLQFIGTVEDITERKQVETQLQENEARFRATFEQAAVGMVSANLSGQFTQVNQKFCEMIGYSESELLEKTFMEITYPDDLTADLAKVELLRQGRISTFSIEKRYLHREGHLIWVNLSASVVRQANGEPNYFMAVIKDISDRKKAEENLQIINAELEQRVIQRTTELQQAKEAAEAANQAKSVFLANISHELRTPLNGIMGYAQILQRSPQLSSEHKNNLQVIYQCGSHLLTLIEDILNISKIEAGRMELYPKKFPLFGFLEEIVEICRIKAEQKALIFNYQPDSSLPTVIKADQKRLRQVLLNLLGNAIKFTQWGSVSFRIRFEGSPTNTQDCLEFEIEDTGIGISADEIEKIFLPFEQVGSLSQKAEGTGLGLSISQKILNMMESQLKVQSTLGVGSIFSFGIPISSRNQDAEITGETLSVPRVIVGYNDPWFDQSIAQTASVTEFIVPPVDILKKLIDLAKQGRILKLAEETQKLKQQNQQWTAFAEHLTQLANEFELEKICQFLNQYYS